MLAQVNGLFIELAASLGCTGFKTEEFVLVETQKHSSTHHLTRSLFPQSTIDNMMNGLAVFTGRQQQQMPSVTSETHGSAWAP